MRPDAEPVINLQRGPKPIEQAPANVKWVVCSGPAALMAKHPEASLYRCRACSHVFSLLDAPHKAEVYD
ncbi:MAG: hypothetical protein WA005_04585 [Candidatus Binataceae bacterium]